MINSFIWNRRWTFKSDGRVTCELSKFMIVSMISLLLNMLLATSFIEILKLEPALAQAIVIIVIAVISFVLHKKWSFR